MKRQLWNSLVAVALLATPLLSGCYRQPAPPPPPTPEVSVVALEPQRIVLTTELPGRTSAYRMSEIRPQVSGLILKRLFTEGSDVKAGDVLYEIEPAPFQAAYNSSLASLDAARKAADRARAAVGASTANVARAQATLQLAKTNNQRFEDLFKEKAVSASERDQAATDMTVAEATVKAAEAQVESDKAAIAAADAAVKQAEAAVELSKISLAYTKITAPIPGRVGRSNVTEGATVTAYQPMALATVQEINPIYVDVPQSTAELNRLKRSVEYGRMNNSGERKAVKLVMQDGTTYPHEGALKFQDITVDPTTGSVILRIEVPNPDSVLLPGMFVRAIVEEGVNEQAMLVPQQAVTRDPRGNAFALVLAADGKVEQRPLKAERAIGDKWLVSSGVKTGDRIIVEGVQKARPGMPAKLAEPKLANAATTQSATAAQ